MSVAFILAAAVKIVKQIAYRNSAPGTANMPALVSPGVGGFRLFSDTGGLTARHLGLFYSV
jgi:hypothetical protein